LIYSNKNTACQAVMVDIQTAHHSIVIDTKVSNAGTGSGIAHQKYQF
jgi:hypothetical protein